MLRDSTQGFAWGARWAWWQLLPSKDKFSWELVVNVPTPDVVIKILVVAINILNIDGEPSLLQFSHLRIVLNPLLVLTATCSPSSSWDLTSGRKLSLIFHIRNKNCPSSGHLLSHFLFYFLHRGYFDLEVSWVVFYLFIVISCNVCKGHDSWSTWKNREGDVEGIHSVHAEWMNTWCLLSLRSCWVLAFGNSAVKIQPTTVTGKSTWLTLKTQFN